MHPGKRIIFVLCGTELGGAENQAILLANEIKQRNHYEVLFILFNLGKGPIPGLLDKLGIGYYLFNWPFSRFFGLNIVRLLRFTLQLKKLKPSILMPYTTYPNIFSSFIWKYSGAKKCIWNQRDEGLAMINNWFTRKAVSNASEYIANSASSKKFLIEKFAIDEKKITVIRNGIKLNVLTNRNEWRKEHSFEANDVLICMIANLTKLKDHETLLRSFHIIRTQMNMPVKLLLAGRFDDNFKYLLNLSHELGISKSTYFLGKVNDIGSFLNAMDLSVLSSFSEGLSNVIIESMFLGVPVTGSRIDGIIEAVGEEYEKYLALPGNYDDLAEKILYLLNNPSIALRLADMNKTRAISQFSVESLYQFTINVINSSN